MNDLDHFVLQPGETLILRARKPLSAEQTTRLQEWLDKRKVPAIVIATPDVDIMAGMLSNLMPDDEVQAHCDAVIDAYDEGKTVWGRDIDGTDWFIAHKHAFPLEIDFTRYEFSLTDPTK
jgi:hypothetical protein